MVRLKQRYLLLDILYPDPSSWPSPHSSTPTTPAVAAAAAAKKTSDVHLRIHAPTADTLSPGLLAKMIREQVSELFGDWGVGRLGGVNAGGVSVKYLSPATSTAIIRCPRASYRLVWTAVTYLSHVPDFTSSTQILGTAPGASAGTGTGKRSGPLTRPCVFRVVKVSGTMRKAEEEAIRRGRREVARVKGAEEEGVLGLVEAQGVVDDGDGDEDEMSE